MLERLDGHLFGADQKCFGCGPNHPIGFHLKFEVDGDAVVTRFTPGAQYQGPPGIMHGGLVMTLADETGAWALLAFKEKFGFTASVEGKLRRPVRIGVETEARSWIVKESSRVVRVAVKISQGGEACFETELGFVLMDKFAAEKMLQGPIPEEWLRFCR
jgi:acyl-coenzyme A thioesterase PaaI-like protein